MGRFVALLYGGIIYVLMMSTFLYFYGFITNVWVPKGIDVGERLPLNEALPMNIGLLLLFVIQQIMMTRPGFKTAWAKILPQSIERSTYVLISCVVLSFVFLQWRPMGPYLWDSHAIAMYASTYSIFVLGSFIAVIGSLTDNHLHNSGFGQVWSYVWGREYTSPPFTARWLRRLVRHPVYLGFLMMIWANPHMSYGRLTFAAGMTVYFLVAIWLEERELAAVHGDVYREYQQKAPMLFPIPGKVHPRV